MFSFICPLGTGAKQTFDLVIVLVSVCEQINRSPYERAYARLCAKESAWLAYALYQRRIIA